MAYYIGQELVPPNFPQNEKETKFGRPEIFREEGILQMTGYAKSEKIS